MMSQGPMPLHVRRGEVYDARLDPVEGSEQAGTRPVVIVSRDTINASSSVILGAPCTTFRGQHVYRSQVIVNAPHGGLTTTSVVLTEQVRALSKTRLVRWRGALPPQTMDQIGQGLIVALALRRAR